MTRHRTDPNHSSALQAWFLLILSIPVFLPTSYFFRQAQQFAPFSFSSSSWFVCVLILIPRLIHVSYLLLQLSSSGCADTEAGRLGLYAQKCLLRCLEAGPRKQAPSCIEVRSLLPFNPYYCHHHYYLLDTYSSSAYRLALSSLVCRMRIRCP